MIRWFLRGKSKWLPLLAGAAALAGFCLIPDTSHAQDNPTHEARTDRPANLDALLEAVRRGEMTANGARQEKLEAFAQADDGTQAGLLAAAIAAAERAESRSAALETEFNENERLIAERTQTLTETLGPLAGFQDVVADTTRQTAGNLRQSLVSAQMPGRDATLLKLGGKDPLPQITAIENLWVAFLGEMTAQGQVARFEANVIAADGTGSAKTVTRIGPFTAIADDRLLAFLPDTGQLAELTHQPPGGIADSAEQVTDATGGVIPAPIDPSRGEILTILDATPGLLERIRQGRHVGYLIIAVGLAGLAIALRRIFILSQTARAMAHEIRRADLSTSNPLGRLLTVYNSSNSADIEALALKLDDAILKEIPALQHGTSTLKMLAAVAPLLGLLGTVIGMIETFQAVTLFGTGDPKLMAEGISTALVTTALGLVVAIPLLFLHSFVSSRSKNLIQLLEEQSASLLAGHPARPQPTASA